MRQSVSSLVTSLFVGSIALSDLVSAARVKTPRDSDVVFAEDFEDGSLDQWDYQACPNGVTIVSSEARTGNHSAQFTVSDDDTSSKCPDVPTDNPRAQIVSPGLFSDGEEYYIAFSVFFPEGFPQPGDWFQLVELYGEPFGGSPTMGVDICNGNQICFERDESHNYDSIWEGDAIEPGKWRDITLHVNFSTDAATGFVEIWDGGKQQTLSNGDTRVYYQTLNPDVNWDGTPNSLFLNQYRAADAPLGTVTLYHDSVKVGTTFDSVQPGS